METLKSGDVPALVTNVEVMEILAARVEARRVREEENTTEAGTSGYGRKRLRKKPEHRHRDWIELKVLNDLKNSPCGVGGIDKTRELVGRIRGRAVAPAPGGGGHAKCQPRRRWFGVRPDRRRDASDSESHADGDGGVARHD